MEEANTIATSINRSDSNRQRKVVATSANPEVVSHENFTKRLEGMKNDASSPSSAVACVNCNRERGGANHRNGNCTNSNHGKRRPFARNRGKANINNNNNSGNRKKTHPQQQQFQQIARASSPIVVNLKASYRSKNNLSRVYHQSSLDADSDASSSRSTDEDQWPGVVGDHRVGEDESYELQSSSVSEDLASSPEAVSHLKKHYQNQTRPGRYEKSRKSFRGSSRLISSSKGHQYHDGFYHSNSHSHKAMDSPRKNLTAFISELEKPHVKARDIEINLIGNANDDKRPPPLLNNHSVCDCKDGLNNSCKCLFKDVEFKRKNVADCDNIDLICNDLFTSNEKLSEESTDESDTSDKASVISSSDTYSDDAGRGSPAPNVRNVRKFSAEELEDLAEYTTGAPLVQYDYHPSPCSLCIKGMEYYPYPNYYPYFDSLESHPASRSLYDVHAYDPLFHHYHYLHQHSYHRHQQQPHYNRRHNRHHMRSRQQQQQHHHHTHGQHLYYQHPLQHCNHWVIERPRLSHDKLSATTPAGHEYPSSSLEENAKGVFSTSSPSSSVPSSPPAMMTTSSNTVVTVCTNASLKSPGQFAPLSKQRSLSQSDDSAIKESSHTSIPADGGKDVKNETLTSSESKSKSKSKPGKSRNGSKSSCRAGEASEQDSHKACSLSNSVCMDLTGLDVKFSVFYPGDPEHLSWPAIGTTFHPSNVSPSLWIPPNVSYSPKYPFSPSPLQAALRPFRRSSKSPFAFPSNTSNFEIQNYELAMPSNRPWIDAGSPDKDVPAAVFTVMNYNVLSDKLCTKQMYGYCPTWALTWDYRKKGIMSDIAGGNADIISLQEVETEQYYGLFLPELIKRDYEGIFLPKSRVRTMNSDKEKMSVDGCAIFFKKTKFEKVNEHHVEFSQLATKDGASNTDSDMINRVSTKDNIAIVAMLRTKPAAYEASPVPAPKGLSQMLMVSTAHIHWDPQLPDVKLVQTIMLVEELRKFIKEASVQFRPNAPPPSVNTDMCSSLPLILCGDFNSLPDSGVFEFLSKGKLDTSHRDFDGQNYKAFMKDRNENGILNHNFNLTSAYKDVIPFTNYTFDFKGVIDYIFYSGQHIRLHGVMGLQDEEWFRVNKIVGCPHPFVPSDHFPLFAEFSLPAAKPAPIQKPR